MCWFSYYLDTGLDLDDRHCLQLGKAMGYCGLWLPRSKHYS